MNIVTKKDNGKNKFLRFLKSGAISYIFLEAIEQIIEEVIAISLATVVSKVISWAFVFIGLQTVKITSKGLWVLIKAFIKKITYKEGHDKMEKIKKFFESIKLNPKTTIGAIASFIASVGVGGATTFATYLQTSLPEWATYLIGGVVFVVLLILTEIGVFGKGKESQSQIMLREVAEAFGFEQAYNVVSEAKSVLDKAEAERLAEEEQKKAEEEAQKLEAERIAKEIEEVALKEKEEAEQKAKAEQEKALKEKALKKKAEYEKAVSEGYTGTLVQWLSENK